MSKEVQDENPPDILGMKRKATKSPRPHSKRKRWWRLPWNSLFLTVHDSFLFFEAKNQKLPPHLRKGIGTENNLAKIITPRMGGGRSFFFCGGDFNNE